MLDHNLLCEILVLLQEKSSGRTDWIMDSGCTNHMTGDRNLVMESSLSPSSKKTITFADKGKVRYWVSEELLSLETNILTKSCWLNPLGTT